jgi:hypothetical protein
MLNPLIVGRWDGSNVWLQWTPPLSGLTALRMRYRRPGETEWMDWIDTNIPWPMRGGKSFLRLPIHKQNWQAEAQMAEWKPGAMEWEPALAARFTKCTAKFEFLSERRWSFEAGTIFNAVVDGAGTGWRLLEAAEFIPGRPSPIVEMQATQSTGVHQLDYAGHLRAQPELGLWITNTEASREDCELLGGSTVTIEPAPLDGPVAFVTGGVNRA